MLIALAQINPTIGDIDLNTRKHVEFIRRAKEAGARLVIFPELSIIGYPPKDLLLQPTFIDDTQVALEQLAHECNDIAAIVGYPQRNPNSVGRPLHNAVALLDGGKISSRHFKTLLPTYDVFDESRYFEPGPTTQRNEIVELEGTKFGINICEDLWNDERFISRRLYHQNPIADLNAAGADIFINCSASPFVLDKHEFRIKLFGGQAERFGIPLIFVNQVGGNDELIFDGNSMVLDASGSVVAQAKGFDEDLILIDTESWTTNAVTARPQTGLDSVYNALLLGLRDYVNKCGFKSVVLGLSGGIDSALVAALAAQALGAEKVTGIAMPSRFSSEGSMSDARALANNLGIHFEIVVISEVHDCYENLLLPFWPDKPRDTTEENLQARIRGAILMAFSNKFGHLLLTTGNKSELAVGYCTLYGDMCGGLAVINDVPKTMVWDLSRFINQKFGREIIPQSSIDKVPSAELRPNQTDQDSLPPYDLLDRIVEAYVEDEKSISEIIKMGIDEATVRRMIRLIDRSEYKRRQSAPGLKVTSRAFGSGRRMPIAQNYTGNMR